MKRRTLLQGLPSVAFLRSSFRERDTDWGSSVINNISRKTPPDEKCSIDLGQWNSYRFDSSNSGYNKHAFLPEKLKLRWRYQENTFSEPVIHNEKIYQIDGGDVVEIDLNSGLKEGEWGIDSAFPNGFAIHDDKLILCSDLRDNRTDTSMFALDIEDGLEDDQRPEWEFESGFNDHSAPAVDGDTIYVGGGDTITMGFEGDGYKPVDTKIFAIDANTGEEIWRYKKRGSGVGNDTSPPAVGHGHVYVTARGLLIAIDKETGEEVWSRESGPFGGYLPPVVYRDGVLTYDSVEDELLFISKDGERVRSRHVGNGYYFTPVVTDKGIIANKNNPSGDLEDTVLLLNDRFEVIWETKLESAVTAGGANEDFLVVAGSERDSEGLNLLVYMIDLDTGNVVWEKKLEGDYVKGGSPIIANNKIVVVGFNSVYLFEGYSSIVAAEIEGPESVLPGEQFTLSSAQEAYRTYWDLNGDGCYEKEGSKIRMQINESTTKVVKMAQRTKGGDVFETETKIRISHRPEAEIAVSPTQPSPNEEVTLDASKSHDSDGTIDEYAWDVDGDDTYEYTGEQITHVYDTLGSKDITLRVTGDAGLTATDETSVTVVSESTTSQTRGGTRNVPGFGIIEGISAACLAGYSLFRRRTDAEKR